MAPTAVSTPDETELLSQGDGHVVGVDNVKIVEDSEADRGKDADPPAYPLICSNRFALCLLVFSGLALEYAMRINISSALICMVNHTAVGTASKKNNVDGDFVWYGPDQQLILAGFFYGYIVTQVLAGLMAEKFGAAPVIMWTMLASAIFTLFNPPAAHVGLGWLFVLRIVIGMSEGSFLPAVSQLWSKWAPPKERSVLIALGFTGTQMGSIMSLFTSGFICTYLDWSWIFYIHGGLGVIWCTCWFFISASSPAESKTVSDAERDYIQSSLHVSKIAKPADKFFDKPWRRIFTSMPCWAIWLCHTGANFGQYLVLTQLPTFMNNVLEFDIKSNGIMSSVPYVALFFTANSAGVIADNLIKRNILSVKNTRKLMNTIGLTGWSISFLAMSCLDKGNSGLAVLLIGIGQGLLGFHVAGVFVNVVDIAPRYSGLIFGLSNMIATIPGFATPAIISWIVKNNEKSEWQTVFMVIASIVVSINIFNVIFADGEVQDWAKSGDAEEDEAAAKMAGGAH